MGFLDFLFGNNNKEEQERLERERLAALERERRAREERERKAKEERARQEAAKNSVKPFVFASNQHQRYENGKPKGDAQNCIRTVTVELNTKGCPGYKLEPGDGYIIKIYNDDLDKPQMADKPMRIYRKSQTSVEFRGFPIKAQTPFGWQEIDLSDYSFIVYYESGKVSKCVLHMHDRNVFIEYRKISKEQVKKATGNSNLCDAEQYALQAREAVKKGNTSLAYKAGLKALESFIDNPSQVSKIKDTQSFALALGKMMEGDALTENDKIIKATAITFYYLTKAIKESSNPDPYLYVYRFSIAYEYNKAFYRLFAHSEGQEYDANPYSIFGHSATMTYEHHLNGMQMCDMFTEPRIGKLDNALNNIFHQIFSQYRNSDPNEVKRIGNQYHNQLYSYISKKIEQQDLYF